MDLETRRREGPLSPADVMTTLIDGIRSEKIGPILPQLWGEAVVQPDILAIVSGVFVQLRATIQEAVAEWAAAHPERIDGDPASWARRVTPVIPFLGAGIHPAAGDPARLRRRGLPRRAARGAAGRVARVRGGRRRFIEKPLRARETRAAEVSRRKDGFSARAAGNG